MVDNSLLLGRYAKEPLPERLGDPVKVAAFESVVRLLVQDSKGSAIAAWHFLLQIRATMSLLLLQLIAGVLKTKQRLQVFEMRVDTALRDDLHHVPRATATQANTTSNRELPRLETAARLVTTHDAFIVLVLQVPRPHCHCVRDTSKAFVVIRHSPEVRTAALGIRAS